MSGMRWGEVRRRVLRVGGALQLILFTSTAASFIATLTGTLWRESRPGCVVHELPDMPSVTFHAGMVVCTASTVDVGLRWPGAAVGVALALVVALASGRPRRAAQGLVLATVVAGVAIFAADQHRWAGPHPAICYPGADGGCAFPAWTVRDLLTGAVVGLILGLLTLAGEWAGRRASASDSLGMRRTVRGILLVGSVPVGVLGLFGVLEGGSDGSSWPRWLVGSAAALFALGLALRPRGGRPVASEGSVA